MLHVLNCDSVSLPATIGFRSLTARAPTKGPATQETWDIRAVGYKTRRIAEDRRGDYGFNASDATVRAGV